MSTTPGSRLFIYTGVPYIPDEVRAMPIHHIDTVPLPCFGEKLPLKVLLEMPESGTVLNVS